MTKTSIHWQIPSIPHWGTEYMANAGAQYVKVMDPGETDPFPGYRTIVRTFLDNALSDQWVAMGAAGADLWMSRFESYYAARPWAHAFEGPNEPSIWNPAILAGFCGFTQRFIQRMHDKGRPVVVGNVNTGWPNYSQIDEIGAGIQGADYLGLHEYGRTGGMWDEEDQTWHCLRYRRTANWLGELGYQVPSIIINECGIDYYDGSTHLAWKDLFTVDEYIDQLLWYETELRKDDFVAAATIFTGTPNDDWMQFEVTEELAMKLASALSELPAPPPPVPRAKGFMASKYQTTLNWDWIALDFDYVILRVSGPNQWPDPTAIEVDPYFHEHWTGAEYVGLPVGGFYFLVPGMDGQAKVFADAIADHPLPLGHFCDVEAAGLTAAKVEVSLLACDSRTGRTTDLYTNPNWLYNILGQQPWMEGRKLWIAHYGAAEPLVPDWWDWTFWQYAGGTVPDNEYASLDVYNGTKEELYEEYELEEEEEEDEMVEVVNLNGEPIENGWADAVARGAELISAEPPDGATVWRVKRLILDTGGSMAFRCYAKSLEGVPIQGIALLMGWNSTDATLLPDDCAPRLSPTVWAQPYGLPNRALILPDPFTGVDGFLEWTWGPGEFLDPNNPAHWCWVMPQSGDPEDDWYTDVIFVPGWWDEHIKYWVEFTKEEGDGGNGPVDPVDGEISEKLDQLIVIFSAWASHLGVELPA